MGRRRWRPEERALLTVGTSVEWRNGSHWHPATVLTVTPSRVEASTEGFERTFTLITTLA